MPRKKEPWDAAVGNAPWAKRLPPAPGDLRIVQAFVNTTDLVTGTEDFKSPQALGDWLVRWGLLDSGTKLGKADLKRMIKVRDGLRALVQANRGGAVDDTTATRLDRAMANAALRVRFDGGAIRFESAASGIEGALGRLALIVALARLAGRWRRLKLCINESCARAFYDASPNRSGKWCTMQACGGRSKARTFRRRHRGEE